MTWSSWWVTPEVLPVHRRHRRTHFLGGSTSSRYGHTVHVAAGIAGPLGVARAPSEASRLASALGAEQGRPTAILSPPAGPPARQAIPSLSSPRQSEAAPCEAQPLLTVPWEPVLPAPLTRKTCAPPIAMHKCRTISPCWGHLRTAGGPGQPSPPHSLPLSALSLTRRHARFLAEGTGRTVSLCPAAQTRPCPGAGRKGRAEPYSPGLALQGTLLPSWGGQCGQRDVSGL